MKDGYDGDEYALLCNNIATTAIKDGYHIIRNAYMVQLLRDFHAIGVFHTKAMWNILIPKLLDQKVFIMMLKILVVPKVKRWVEEQ